MSLLIALLACTAGDSTDDSAPDTGSDTGDPYFYEGPTEFQSLGVDCDEDSHWFDLYTTGWTGGATLWIWHTGATGDAFDEVHPFPTVPFGYDPDGEWENLYLNLDIVGSDAVGGESTVHSCDSDELTYHLVILDPDDGSEADCRVWGQDPDSLGTDCEQWESSSR